MKRFIAFLMLVAMLTYGASQVLNAGVAIASAHAATIEGSR